MMGAYHVANIVSIFAFGTYGLLVLFADGMAEEFERFELSRYRRLTGSLEVLGASGLVVGYLVPTLTLAASGGLALLMVLGIATRVRVRDSLAEILPALVLLAVNVFIFARGLERVQA